VYLTTQARILHVDWLVAGRNRYRSTITIASTAAALVVESTVPSGTVQYSTIHAAQRVPVTTPNPNPHPHPHATATETTWNASDRWRRTPKPRRNLSFEHCMGSSAVTAALRYVHCSYYRKEIIQRQTCHIS